jgi:thioredoxin reductase (NADPH)
MYDVIIIGAGPGGLTAGIYAARSGMSTLLIKSAFRPSIITTTDTVENYPGFPEGIGGTDLVERFTRQAVKFGLEIVEDEVSSLVEARGADPPYWVVKTESQDYDCLSVIASTGAEYTRLNVPGEARFTGRGVSYCATCDGPLFRDANLVVVGGGDTAIQEAIYLTTFARTVTVIHRRDRLRATTVLQDRAFSNPKISFVWNSVVEEITGEDSVRAVKVRDVSDPSRVREIEADGVFIFIGMAPNTALFEGVLEMDGSGYIVVDMEMKTSAPGVFACGDCIGKLLRQVVTACGDGATASFSAHEYVSVLKGTAYKAYTH